MRLLRLVVLSLLAFAACGWADDRVTYAPVPVDAPVVLPGDHGAHPGFKTEWWYVTGWLQTKGGPVGFQLTFFRSRLPFDDGNPSRFAARQVIVGHVALADPATGHLEHGQRLAREGFGLAGAATGETDVVLDDFPASPIRAEDRHRERADGIIRSKPSLAQRLDAVARMRGFMERLFARLGRRLRRAMREHRADAGIDQPVDRAFGHFDISDVVAPVDQGGAAGVDLRQRAHQVGDVVVFRDIPRREVRVTKR